MIGSLGSAGKMRSALPPYLAWLVPTLAGTLIALLAGFVCLGSSHAVHAFPRTISGHVVTIEQTGWQPTLLSIRPRYSLVISRNRPGDGHLADVSMFNADEDIATYLKRAVVTESTDGITFTQPSGHALFVPRRWYEGGR